MLHVPPAEGGIHIVLLHGCDKSLPHHCKSRYPMAVAPVTSWSPYAPCRDSSLERAAKYRSSDSALPLQFTMSRIVEHTTHHNLADADMA